MRDKSFDLVNVRIAARVGHYLQKRDIDGARSAAADILQPLVFRANQDGCGGTATDQDKRLARKARESVKAKFAQFGLRY